MNRIVPTEKALTRFWAKVKIGQPKECWPWQAGTDDHEYGKFRVTRDWCERAHRLALMIETQDFTNNYCALHSCDNPRCCNTGHLRWGTHADNSDDKMSRGRDRYASQQGENNANSKIKSSDIPVIVSLLSTKTNRAIGKQFNISHAMVSMIRRGLSWQKETAALGYKPIPKFIRSKS